MYHPVLHGARMPWPLLSRGFAERAHRAPDMREDAPVIIGDLSARLADARARVIIELSRAVTDWGGRVPEDPGVAELAVLLEDAAANLHHVTSSSTRAELAGAVGHLRAADRLGGLLPAVTLWHLGQALQRAATLPGAQEPTTATGESELNLPTPP
ncbi:hypothetical protein YUYDRAFT_07439 [Streptomyces sp. ScaeMP-e48]|nr:hypothetical protein YUYDRAFT_07439 [Streptomyces sp. ScaeMP-e48]